MSFVTDSPVTPELVRHDRWCSSSPRMLSRTSSDTTRGAIPLADELAITVSDPVPLFVVSWSDAGLCERVPYLSVRESIRVLVRPRGIFGGGLAGGDLARRALAIGEPGRMAELMPALAT